MLVLLVSEFLSAAYNDLSFPTPSAVFVVIDILDDSHADWCEIESQCKLNVHFSLIAKDVECFFKYLLGTCISYF